MATLNNTDNEVYHSLQSPSEVHPVKTAKVIYANKYSGILETPLPEDWAKILGAEGGGVGKNPLVQLENKLKDIPDGPWIIDERNGLLYIHNREFYEDSVGSYYYAQENGELIKLSFETEDRQGVSTYQSSRVGGGKSLHISMGGYYNQRGFGTGGGASNGSMGSEFVKVGRRPTLDQISSKYLNKVQYETRDAIAYRVLNNFLKQTGLSINKLSPDQMLIRRGTSDDTWANYRKTLLECLSYWTGWSKSRIESAFVYNKPYTTWKEEWVNPIVEGANYASDLAIRVDLLASRVGINIKNGQNLTKKWGYDSIVTTAKSGLNQLFRRQDSVGDIYVITGQIVWSTPAHKNRGEAIPSGSYLIQPLVLIRRKVVTYKKYTYFDLVFKGIFNTWRKNTPKYKK